CVVSGSNPIPASKLSDFLLFDKRDQLELEIAMRGNVLTPEILRPENALHNKTILHVAVELEAPDCLELLLSKKSSPSQLDEPDADGCTPLH
ncbi:Ankyrin repeat-containing domain, partial [Trinorchestia longiramus]